MPPELAKPVIIPLMPKIRSVPEMTTDSHDTMMYAIMFATFDKSLKTFITEHSKSTERRERSRRSLQKPKSLQR